MLVEVAATTACAEAAIICWAEAHPGTAAWVQAVLTPLSVAIAAAALLAPGWLHKRQQADARREAVRAAAVAALGSVSNLTMLLEAAKLAQREGVGLEFPKSSLEAGVKPLRDFPVHAVTDLEAARALHSLRLLSESAIEDAEHLAQFANAGGVPTEFVSMLSERADQANEALEILTRRAKA